MGFKIKHGLAHHPVYGVWCHMRTRCYNKKNNRYDCYGGRGISVCEEWRDDPTLFLKWADENGYRKGLYMDRIDNDGNYEPDNCRFVDAKTNITNRRLIQNNNTTGYCGVYRELKSNKNPYRAQIKINGKSCHLGGFTSPVLAALRYDAECHFLNEGRKTNFF